MSWTLRIIMLLAIVASFLGTYKAGEGQGIHIGDNQGYKRAWDEQQKEVDKLTGIINDNREATSKKISALEAHALALQSENNKIKLTVQSRVDDALATFKLEHAQLANSCGLSVEAVGTVRKFMGVTK